MASQTALRSQLSKDPVHHDTLMTTEGSPTPTPYQTRVNTPECETCIIKDNTIMSGNEIVEALKKERLSSEKATDGDRYLEAPVQNSTAIGSTTSVSTQSKYRWLFAYFLINLSLTVCNKLILTKVREVFCQAMRAELFVGTISALCLPVRTGFSPNLVLSYFTAFYRLWHISALLVLNYLLLSLPFTNRCSASCLS